MTELISLIEALLKSGKLRFDITLEVTYEREQGKSQPGRLVAHCPRCKREFVHFTQESLDRAIRSHQHHCSSNGEDMQWIKDQMNGAK